MRFVADRDIVGSINIYLKALKIIAPCLGSWGTRSMTNETRPKGGSPKNEQITIHIKTYTNIQGGGHSAQHYWETLKVKDLKEKPVLEKAGKKCW